MKFSQLINKKKMINEFSENRIVSVEELKKMLIDAYNIRLFKPIKVYEEGNVLNIKVTWKKGREYERDIIAVFDGVWEKLDKNVYSCEYYSDSFNFVISKNGKEFLDFLVA